MGDSISKKYPYKEQCEITIRGSSTQIPSDGKVQTFH